jgi:hypothetical protein
MLGASAQKNGGGVSLALSPVGNGRMKNFLQLISLLLPWKMRRVFLEQQFGFQFIPLLALVWPGSCPRV